jgi:acyl carrier protein
MIAIEDRFVDVVITDEDVDQIDVVGDLIRHLKSARVAEGNDAAVEAPLQ